MGMHCAACSANVEKTASKVAHIVSAKVDLGAAILHIDADDQFEEKDLIEAIKNIGFELIVSEDEDETLKKQEKFQKREFKILSFELIFAWLVFVIGSIVMFIAKKSCSDYAMIQLNHHLFGWSIATYLICGRRYIVGALKQLRHAVFSMDTLVFLSTTAGIIYSAIAMFRPDLMGGTKLHTNSSTMILAFVLLGKFMETKATGKTRSAIRSLLSLKPKVARKIDKEGGEDLIIDIRQIKPGDKLRILPGEEITADGIVYKGESNVIEQMITGESQPAFKSKGSKVFAGTINGKVHELIITAQKTGSDTVLNEIIRVVKEAEATKAPATRIADRIIAIFVPTVLVISLLTLIGWYVIGGSQMVSYALVSAISVLVIACPCALGLATPTAVSVAIGKAARMQILVRSAKALEDIAKSDTFVFDKTGTLTLGKPKVTHYEWLTEAGEHNGLATLLYEVEKRSTHPLAEALCNFLSSQNLLSDNKEDYSNINPLTEPGKGISFFYNNDLYRIGTASFVSEMLDIPIDETKNKEEGSKVYFVKENFLLARFTISDSIPQRNIEVIRHLQKEQRSVLIMTGDKNEEAERVGKILGADQVFGELLPDEKMQQIEELIKQGRHVVMVGDGVNDTEAMTKAEVSIAMSKGSDIAKEVADITLMKSDIRQIPQLIKLSEKTRSIIKQNLFWALIYNAIAIPVASGLFFHWTHYILNPGIAAAAMACSSVLVVTNSLRLTKG